ncbi:ABC transporter substrate-binding protein [Bacillus coahuilensis m2-6]|uniref:ABC transporter substrate-binding protein n=1 Tax=Bacillus coahuilensis TaxID=408580 RepID=UPI0007504E0D|nr:ABC transporter substrate-binding protein [Bacillus coahuilensis]KUP09280.1 ABC transporter substrate-binding protein [Bacillus coahuilensis m2-6]
MKKLVISMFLLGLLVGCSGEKEESANKDVTQDVTVVLDWTPNTNHTGLYVAKEKGFFEEEGLNVDIIMPGESGADQLVASGKADFGVSYQESVTQARVQEVPIVSIAAVIQHNTSGFASPVDKNIQSPKDFEGKVYGGWGAPVEKEVITSLMNTEDGDVEQVGFVNMGDSDFFTAVARDIDFAWIYYGWTGVEAELRGEELNMIYLTDYSEKLDYYTPVLTTNEDHIENDSELVKAFLAAVTKGYEFSIENPSEAADILIEAEPDLDAELVKASQEWLKDKYKDDAQRWGEQKESVWTNYSEWMAENGLLEGDFNATEAFTNDYLPN